MQRRTKIVATVGPASEDPAVLRRMVAAGMNMARLSLAHGPVEETLERIQRVRRAADEEGEIVGVLADLPGPKIRAADFPEGGVYLTEGDETDLVPADGHALTGRPVHGDRRGLLHDESPAAYVHQGVDGAEIDRHACPQPHHACLF